jgi:hypothetical protein
MEEMIPECVERSVVRLEALKLGLLVCISSPAVVFVTGLYSIEPFAWMASREKRKR